MNHYYYFYIVITMKSAFMFVSLFLTMVSPIKIFLMGGQVANNQAQIYAQLAAASGRKPNPNNCDEDWQTTMCPRVAVITSAAPNQNQGNNAYIIDNVGDLSFKTLFKIYGFTSKHVSAHIDNYLITTNTNNPQGQANMEIVKSADIVYFNGGDQSWHSRTWLNDDGTPNQIAKVIFHRAFKDELILSGSSAGAMIMCSPIYGGGIPYGHLYFAAEQGLEVKLISDGAVNGSGLADVRNGTEGVQFTDNGVIMPGFNFAPFLADTHVDTRGRLGRIIPALIQTKKQIGVGIDESSAFYYNNGQGTVYGRNGAFIAYVTNATKLSKQYFAISNVAVSYLTSGDYYDFTTQTTTPSKLKQQIINPKYDGYLDSNDIFNQFQITKLLTRLGDQTSHTNIGRSRIPNGYEANSPVFKIIFEKTKYLSSYWSLSQKKYTIVNATVHIIYE